MTCLAYLPPVLKTLPFQVLWPVANTRCISLSVGDEYCTPGLDHFELHDLASIVRIPDRTSTRK